MAIILLYSVKFDMSTSPLETSNTIDLYIIAKQFKAITI